MMLKLQMLLQLQICVAVIVNDASVALQGTYSLSINNFY